MYPVGWAVFSDAFRPRFSSNYKFRYEKYISTCSVEKYITQVSFWQAPFPIPRNLNENFGVLRKSRVCYTCNDKVLSTS